MRLVLAASIFLLSMSGCTPSVQVQTSTAPQAHYQTSGFPTLGTLARVTVGEAIYTEERYISERAIRVDRAVSETFGLGATVRLPEGGKLVRSIIGERPGYCSVYPSYTEPLTGTPSRSTCFFDTNGDGALDEYWVVGTLESTSRTMRPVPFSQGERQLGEDGFRKELVYQGTDESTVRIKYREFTGNLARPAFSQDLTYTAKILPATIEFRSVKIRIQEIGVSSIAYTPIAGFNEN